MLQLAHSAGSIGAISMVGLQRSVFSFHCFFRIWKSRLYITFLHDSMNSSMVTTPSLFRSIFWNENTKKKRIYLADPKNREGNINISVLLNYH